MLNLNKKNFDKISFEQNKRKHEELKVRLNATPSAHSSYEENESNPDSNESCNILDGEVEHNSTTEFTFLDGSASD